MPPSLAAFHPQVVHFVIALLFVGVALRLVSLLGRPSWLSCSGPAATLLIVLGTIASVVAVSSGDAAHGPAERVPGARPIVEEHEEWGERARNIFLAVAALELVTLAMRRHRAARLTRIASALVGIAGVGALYEAAEHGGELVYSYAGGVGLRTGDPADVERLLLAGLYHQSVRDRAAGRGEAAASLIDEMARRYPADTTVRLLAVESLIADRRNPGAALATLDSVAVPKSNPRLYQRATFLRADALAATGRADSARALLQALAAENPTNPRIKAKLDSLGGTAP